MTNRPEPRRSRLAGSSPVPPPAQDVQEAAPDPSHQSATAGGERTAPRAQSPKVARATETARLGIYLTPVQFDAAKAAYLADWTNGGTADTFARWIGAAIEAHAARTAKQRADLAQPKARSDERTGATRSFSIASDTVARMRAAITADQQAGRWPTDSGWCGEAIDLAVDQARTTNGATLPSPPSRLPNRLVRGA